ncbi:MAG TPA: RNA 2',3'-cyclic phosphodiesterase [Thermoanaerobaculia bacterium]|nr:RNA 2',3'-cyclic phosphodiesterase [Thermoanaerobaculia bacterium]
MRLFIATTFPAEVLRAVNERVDRVRPRLPQASWVRPGSQHLTFAFLGDQSDALVPKIESEVEQELRNVSAFEARLQGCGFFPNPRHARVGWVGVTPEEDFRRVAVAARSGTERAGITLDGSDFKAHLTLMRIRSTWPPASIELFHGALRGFESDRFAVDRVTLFSSQLDPAGAIHTPLHEFALRSH